jgi:putative endopeptidase
MMSKAVESAGRVFFFRIRNLAEPRSISKTAKEENYDQEIGRLSGNRNHVCLSVVRDVIGQTAGGAASSEKTYQLLPGLDKRLIDTTADPCTDFFKYACGNFEKLYPIPSDRSSFGTGAMIAEYTQNVLHTMLEKAAAGGSGRNPNEQKIGDNYAACMDVDAINQRGLKPLQPELDRIAALKSKDELPELLAHFQLIGVNAFLSFGQQQDFKDARKQIAVVDQGGLGLPERDY